MLFSIKRIKIQNLTYLDFLKERDFARFNKTSIKSEFPEINPETHNVTKVSKHNIFATYSNNSGITDPWEKDSTAGSEWKIFRSNSLWDYLNEDNSNLSKEEIWE